MSTRRLFFALWPDAAMRDALSAATSDVVRAATRGAGAARGGRPVPLENLHITLAFLGAVADESLPAVQDVARTLAGRGGAAGAQLAVTLDAIDYWRRARIVCAAASGEPAGAAELAGALRSALSSAGFRPDLKPFHAHVTLARQVRRAPPEARMLPVTWTFDGFALIESSTGPAGPSYSVVDSWTLCGAGADQRAAEGRRCGVADPPASHERT